MKDKNERMNFKNEVQIVNTVLSVDPDYSPEMAAMLGSSLAVSISKIPFNGPIAGVIVGRVDGEFVEVEKSDNIRLIYAGEYGELHERPHYHLILFNMEVPDQILLRNSKKGNPLFWSKLIEDIWGKGMVILNEVNWEYAAYVARYIMKKQKGLNSAEYYLAKGYEPEFFRMSRRPGIGKEWFELHKDEIYKNDEMFVKTKKGVLKIKPNSYYDRLFDADNPELMAEIKERRAEHAKNAQKLVMQNTTLNEQEYREVQERTKLEKIKSLTRDAI